MNTDKAMPEEIREMVYAERVSRYPPKRHNAANSMKNLAFKLGAEWMYHHLAPSITQLKEQNEVFRKALEKIYSHGMFGYINGDPAGTLALIAKEVLDLYPLPKIEDKNIDNG